MKSVRKFLVLVISLSLFISACNSGGPKKLSGESAAEMTLEALSFQLTVDGAIEQTIQAGSNTGNVDTDETEVTSAPTNTPVSDPATATSPPPATATSPPSATAVPQSSATPTLSVPMIEVSIDTNCRTGPGQGYNILGALLVGEETEIIAWDGYGYNYYVVNPDGGGGCWLWGQYATTSGDTSDLPVFTPPPTITPTFTATPELLWKGNWSMIAEGVTYSVVLTQSGNTVSGSFLTGSGTATFSGTISADGKTVSGTYSVTNGTGGTFIWQLKKNTNQFVGHGVSNANVTGNWCGHRSGASAPSPCYGP